MSKFLDTAAGKAVASVVVISVLVILARARFVKSRSHAQTRANARRGGAPVDPKFAEEQPHAQTASHAGEADATVRKAEPVASAQQPKGGRAVSFLRKNPTQEQPVMGEAVQEQPQLAEIV